MDMVIVGGFKFSRNAFQVALVACRNDQVELWRYQAGEIEADSA
jgi:hypothetical protein